MESIGHEGTMVASCAPRAWCVDPPSGVVNTSFMMGGALGLATLASLAAARTDGLAAAGADAVTALNGVDRVLIFESGPGAKRLDGASMTPENPQQPSALRVSLGFPSGFPFSQPRRGIIRNTS
nr:hypothetical protein [Trinickia mobilis]